MMFFTQPLAEKTVFIVYRDKRYYYKWHTIRPFEELYSNCEETYETYEYRCLLPIEHISQDNTVLTED